MGVLTSTVEGDHLNTGHMFVTYTNMDNKRKSDRDINK